MKLADVFFYFSELMMLNSEQAKISMGIFLYFFFFVEFGNFRKKIVIKREDIHARTQIIFQCEGGEGGRCVRG